MTMKLYSDTDIQAIANAIRTKNGSSDTYTVSDMAQAITDIPTGEFTLTDIASGTKPAGVVDLTGIKVGMYGLSGKPITSVSGHLASGSKINGLFYKCNSLVTANIVIDDGLDNAGDGTFQSCQNLETIVFICNGSYNNQMNSCNGDSKLKTVDIKIPRIRTNFFWNCSSLDTLIIRNTSVIPLENISNFNQSKFKNGGAGGDIYIPKILYDALGTGTNDYKSATNWSTLNGYGTITWHAIEGSIYENYYADGTPISS